MEYLLKYHPDVRKVDIARIDARMRAIIKKAIEERLFVHPEMYGKPLRRSLKGFWKLRVGDCRVVFKIIEREIHILGIIHRKEVYTNVRKRLD